MKRIEPVARLVNAFEEPPANLEEVLRELGAGDHRFKGTSFGRGEMDLPAFLQECRDGEDPAKVEPGKAPGSAYWLVDASGKVVGLVRTRHRLNERLLQYGGNIGYYIRPSERGKGYGKLALRLALEKFRQAKVPRVLVTAHPANTLSQRVILANGGVQEGQGKDPITGQVVNRYWIALEIKN